MAGASTTTSPTTSGYRWVMLGILWIAYVSFGVIAASIAPLIAPISADLDLSRSAMGLVLGAWALAFIFAAIPAGTILDRIGIRKGIAIGLAVIAASGFARALAPDGITLFIAVFVFGLGGPVMSVGSPKLISQWFDASERGTAIGIYMTGPYIGSALALASANSVFMPLFDQSWRATLAVFAAFVVVAMLIWIVFAREPAAPTSTASRAAPGWKEFAVLLRIPLVRTVLAMTLIAFLFNHALNSWLPEILRAGGMDATAAGLWSALPTLVGIVAALTLPRLATPPRRVDMLTMFYVSMLISSLLLAFTGIIGTVIALVLFGLARIVSVVMTLILLEAPGVDTRNTATAAGLYFTAGEIGGVLGPTILGVVADLSGDFTMPLVVMAATTVALLAMTARLRVLARVK